MALAGLGVSYDLLGATSDTRSKANEDRQAKRLGEMQDAIKRLRTMGDNFAVSVSVNVLNVNVSA